MSTAEQEREALYEASRAAKRSCGVSNSWRIGPSTMRVCS
jgi:hypothetical protein